MGAEWRELPGWPYMVSSLGQVVRREPGMRQRCGPCAPLRQHKNRISGYLYVVLFGRSRVRATVHTLVLRAFVGLPRPGLEARHLNGIRTDNRICNLAWGTRTENAADRLTHGTDWNGDKHKNRVLSEALVRELRDRYAGGGVTFSTLATELGVDIGTIHKAIRGKTWKAAGHVGVTRGHCYEVGP